MPSGKVAEEARFVSCHDLGDRDVEIYRIDNDGAQAFHFYERVIGDTNAVAIGKVASIMKSRTTPSRLPASDIRPV